MKTTSAAAKRLHQWGKHNDLQVADIGDGLCAQLNGEIILDCGGHGSNPSGERGEKALQNFRQTGKHYFRHWHPRHWRPRRWYSAFLLSHFHADHYRGILRASRNSDLHKAFVFEHFLYPRLPELPDPDDTKTFWCAFRTLDAISLGRRTGIMEKEIHAAVQKLSYEPTSMRAVSKGDVFLAWNQSYTVHWPPSNIEDPQLTKKVRDAANGFRDAIERNQEIQSVYHGIEERYGLRDSPADEAHPDNDRQLEDEHYDWEIDEKLAEAIDKLKKAADDLSIVFSTDDFLFMGDLRASTAGKVVESLLEEGQTRYGVIMPPHHGTRWGKKLAYLDAAACVSSGHNSVKNELKAIAPIHLVTGLNGSIHI